MVTNLCSTTYEIFREYFPVHQPERLANIQSESSVSIEPSGEPKKPAPPPKKYLTNFLYIKNCLGLWSLKKNNGSQVLE